MQPIVRPLFVLHPDPALYSALSRIPGQPYTVTAVSTWAALGEALRRAPLTSLSVVDPRAPGAGVGLSDDLPRLLRAFPSATVLGALPVTPDDSDRVLTLATWGVADVIDLVRERTPEAVGRRLHVVQGWAVQRLLRRALPPMLPGRTRTLLGVAAEVVSWGGQGSEFAAALGVTTRTVARWCQRADLPPMRRILAWMRILQVAELLDDPGRSLESAARACGYAGASSLKQALSGFLGKSPRALRETGAFETAAQAFREELRAVRERARIRGKPEKVWLN